ncbi:MAG: ATP-binding protein, partial [Oscillospiraceae bacterium]|nr:ATP-binding protein [Oscillospiraceae bacterium]
EQHFCRECQDRGVLRDGRMCRCKRALISEYEAQRIAKASPLALCSFDSFTLDYYSTDIDPSLGISQRENMKNNLSICREFAASFPNHRNLLMMGSAGLGKTHLALSIADSLIRKGYDVIYCSCANIFSKIEQERADYSRHSDTLQSLKQCSLLVLDDLGSEYVTASVSALLYDIVNTRLSEGSSTIITTKLTEERLLNPRYGEKVTSRLIGCFDVLPFTGSDIRLKKNGY